MAVANPKNITVRGRLSFPRFKHAEAVAFAAKSDFDKSKTPDQINSSFSLLLEQDQLDKLVNHILNEFLPYAQSQNKKGERTDGSLDPKYVEKIRKFLEAGDWADNPPFMPFKPLNPKYAADTPECVARLEVKGPKSADITLKARVEDESQLTVVDPDVLVYPVIKPLEQTVFDMYPGAYVAATLNLYAYFKQSAIFGIGAGSNVAVYMGNLEGERLGNGASLDEDEIFMD